jgi:hypothetical protein
MSSFKEPFEAMVRLFQASGTDYYITRNYEGYPDEFTGDIDIHVDLSKFRAYLGDLERIFDDHDWRIFRKTQRPWILAYQLINHHAPDGRPVMVVEFFNGFHWRCFEYLEMPRLEIHREWHKNISVLPETLGYLLAFTHYALWCGFVPRKYHARVCDFARSEGAAATLESLMPWGSGLLEKTLQNYVACSDDDWSRLSDVPEEVFRIGGETRALLKKLLVRSAFKARPARMTFEVFRMAYLRLTDVLTMKGRLFLIRGGSGDEAQALLFTLKKFHLFKNHAGRTVSSSQASTSVLKSMIASLVQGGACVGPVEAFSGPLRLLLMLLSRRVTCIEAGDSSDFRRIEKVVGFLER